MMARAKCILSTFLGKISKTKYNLLSLSLTHIFSAPVLSKTQEHCEMVSLQHLPLYFLQMKPHLVLHLVKYHSPSTPRYTHVFVLFSCSEVMLSLEKLLKFPSTQDGMESVSCVCKPICKQLETCFLCSTCSRKSYSSWLPILARFARFSSQVFLDSCQVRSKWRSMR